MGVRGVRGKGSKTGARWEQGSEGSEPPCGTFLPDIEFQVIHLSFSVLNLHAKFVKLFYCQCL